jgi:hypothetical protein
MQIQRPVTVKDAIKFAEVEFANSTVFWPRLLVVHIEEVKPLGAIRFAIDTYKHLATMRKNAFVLNLVTELNGWMDSQEKDVHALRQRSLEVWEDPSDRSLLKRGITRIFNALADLIEARSCDYEVEITRALHATMDANNGCSRTDCFQFIVGKFRKEYGNE